ncbi:MAG: alanine dehydrogenase [Acidimicrobiales bacterium]|nr:alanine dehydrogenase [Acidimicrobiales bacterium]
MATHVVGIPAEVKADERRVALTPDGVRELEAHGVDVLVEAGAGEGASIADDAYAAAGAELVDTAAEVWARADLVCKVKEPQAEELPRLRAEQTLFTYLHLAAYPDLARGLCHSGTTALAYETVMREDGQLPLLAPMSEVAGRMAVQAGARFLEAPQGGRGVLLGGAPGVQPGRVVVIGAGNVGWNAAWIAAGMEAEVNLLDRNLDRLRVVDQIHKGRISTLASNRGTLERCIAEADLVIGAVLLAGGRAPVVVTEDMVRSMRPGSVIVDVAIDQGGCVATARETTHHDPTYVVHDVVHYCVGNIPGAVPATSTHALTNATLPYIVALAVHGTEEAIRLDPVLAAGLNVQGGALVHPAVAEALGVAVGHAPPG